MLKGEDIVSVCLSGFVGGKYHGIDIETERPPLWKSIR
ncbi:hypothetical protein [Alkalihalobacterium elongatum]